MESYRRPNLAGPGDARPTALQIIEDEGLTGALTSKVFLITGVSSGIGIETLRALHATGAHIIGTVRNLEKGHKVVDEILTERKGGKITLVHMDLDSFASVRAGAAEILSLSEGRLNVLIANAGIMAVPFALTTDGYESQFATNHLGHVSANNLFHFYIRRQASGTLAGCHRDKEGFAKYYWGC
jgi:NAD(P)-dependent dehydrogenase (short-subunit alcohol dehydrogenase family)